MNNTIYDMQEFSPENGLLDGSIFILAIDEEERSKYVLESIISTSTKCKGALAFIYDDKCRYVDELQKLENIVGKDNYFLIEGFSMEQSDFIKRMKGISPLVELSKIVIDISCILTPYLFLLLKCLYIWNPDAEIYAINTIPFDYAFLNTPFTSYRSYFGDLKNEEIIGFSSMNGAHEKNELFIFSGFEGALALKVVEDTEFSNLVFVNALPSYYQKYKDISIINNYQLLQSRNCNMAYVPANNPYEVYNFLDKQLNNGDCISVAPLCTKPISLGICMYALQHQNIRVIYPFSKRYESGKSHKVYKSHVFHIPFQKLRNDV